MKNYDHICFIGGDERQRYAAEMLADHIKIHAVGKTFEDIKNPSVINFENPNKAMYEAKAVVLPIPAAVSEGIIPFTDLVENITRSDSVIHLLGGKFSPYLKGIILSSKVKHYDYYEDEIFTIKNAYLTAEGALQLAMASIKGSIRQAKCAIIGYGRIGRALGEMMKAIGANTTVFARKEEMLVWAEHTGLYVNKIVPGKESSLEVLSEFDIVFNTVPERIITNEILLGITSKTLLIELASPPGGFDPDIAEQCEVNFIKAGGLPGKYAPITAGRIVGETIVKFLKKEGIL